MMADDSDDDKPLLFQFKNSKGSVKAKCSARHGASSSLQNFQEKPSKFPDCGVDNATVNASQTSGLLHDGSASSREPLPNSLAARVFAQTPESMKVYKRKKPSDDENPAAKKLKSSSDFAGVASDGTYRSVHASKNLDQGKEENANGKSLSAGDIDNGGGDFDGGIGCREHDADIGAINGGDGHGADFGVRDDVDASGGTHIKLEAKKKKLADDRDTQIDDPRLACDVACKKPLASKAAARMGMAEDEEEDNLPLSKFSRSKKHNESDIKNVTLSARKNAVKEECCGISVKEEEEDDHLPLSKLSRPQKNKESAIDDKKVSAKKNAVKEEGCHTAASNHHDMKEKRQTVETLAKVSKGSGNTPENRKNTSAKKQKDGVEDEQFQGDDDLPLIQMSRPKKRKAPSEKDAGKEKESRRNDDHVSAVSVPKLLEDKVADTSTKSFEDKIEDIIPNADDVSLDKPSYTKREKIADVTQEVSGKGANLTVGLVSKSRAKQLLALSKSLEDTDSEEEEEQEKKVDDDDDDDEEDEEDEEEEDDDEDEDEDYNFSKASKIPALNRAEIPSTTLKVRASGQSKTRTPKSSSKSAKKIVSDEESEEEEDDSEEEDEDWEEDDDDDEEYNVLRGNKRKKTAVARAIKTSPGSSNEKQAKRKVTKMKDVPGAGGGQKWTTLQHNGVIFPPFYQPHGIKMLYEGKPVDLTPEQEEVATMFAVMKETDYALKPKFLANFWNDWKKLLGPNHKIKKLEDCEFTPIYEWHLAEKEKKKQLSSQEKKAIKEERLKQEEKYMWAIVDGVKEKVGNFRVEPPGLFRGRGEHPKMGLLKRRIYPEDIVINIGADSPVPESPLPGHSWKEVRHDNTVTWLAYWTDPVNTKEQKYVFLSASSTLKGQSDKEKYEKARVLKDYIEDIRKTYTENFTSSDPTSRQIAVATYLIDQLALRAGNEKDDDEADTVGCCSLKVEHVSLIPPKSLQFDFLGKDSIRYFNVVPVAKPVYEAVGDFRKDKAAGSDLFDRLDTNKLNAHLKNIMPQLTAKVFRTYNASVTLDNLLVGTDGHVLAEKIAAYQQANKEVAILCNHQRSVSKSHGAQMEKLEGKLAEFTELVDELQKDLERARKGKPPLMDSDGNPKKNQNPDVLEKKISQAKQKMERMKLDMSMKEDLKTVALGTSKINYMDPRITVAWCKKHEVPIEKIFNKSLLAKFAWAMDAETSFRF